MGVMKQLIRLTILFCTCAAMMTAFAGTETYSGKEMKQVAPAPPPECNWSGFYVGLHVAGSSGTVRILTLVTMLSITHLVTASRGSSPADRRVITSNGIGLSWARKSISVT